MLRNLLIRGLVRRVLKKGGRGYRYRPTTELLAHLGITRMEDLPDYIKVKADLEAFEKHYKESEEDIQPE
jgi:chromosome segregation and condensation protein ScpB